MDIWKLELPQFIWHLDIFMIPFIHSFHPIYISEPYMFHMTWVSGIVTSVVKHNSIYLDFYGLNDAWCSWKFIRKTFLRNCCERREFYTLQHIVANRKTQIFIIVRFGKILKYETLLNINILTSHSMWHFVSSLEIFPQWSTTEPPCQLVFVSHQVVTSLQIPW